MKEYKYNRYYGYNYVVQYNLDIGIYFLLDKYVHGLYHHWCDTKNGILHKGKLYDKKKYSHWIEFHERFNYYL